jgi:hypothetical protein
VSWSDRSEAPRDRRGLGVLLSLYVLMGLAFNAAIPPFEAPDEPDHFAYVLHLYRVQRLPVQAMDGPPSESHQPPLNRRSAAKR